MARLGCSSRVVVLVAAVVVILLLVGLISGSLGSSLFGHEVIPFLAMPKPEPSLAPEAVFTVGGFPITNTIIAFWLTIVVVVGLAYLGTRKLKVVPGRMQALVEFGIQTLLNFVEGFAGRENGRRFFPVVATIFIAVIFNAYMGLLPFFGEAIRLSGGGPLFRAANTDINVPTALALVSVIYVEFWGASSVGLGKYLTTFFNFGGIAKGFGQLFRGNLKGALSGIFLGFINAFVGILELLSHFVRLMSFTLRLFGNMTAGEFLIVLGVFLVPLVVTSGIFVLELLVGFVQALVFAGLTLAFAMVAVSSHDEGH